MQFLLRALAERVFKAPAEALEATAHLAQEGERELFKKGPVVVAEEYFSTLGPGLITGAADDDPSGIATYSQAGAQYGFQLLWLSVFTFPLMAIVQEMCARIGIVTGRGLAAGIRREYGEKTIVFVCILLFAANTLNIAADLGAMSAAMQLLIPQANLLFLVAAFALVSVLLQVYMPYARYATILKYLTLALLSYVFTAFAVGLNWGDVLHHTFFPSFTFSGNFLFLLCAILGTTISPYLFFWQTSQEVEEKRAAAVDPHPKSRHLLSKTIRNMRIDVWTGMFVSNLVMFFIIAACGATLFANGITTIDSAAQAALAIRPFGGALTFFFFAVGIVGTGLLAIPILAGSSAYAIAEAFGWRRGLYQKLSHARAFYGVIIVSMFIGVLANVLHVDPIRMLIYSAVFNGVVAPVVLFFIVRLSSRLPTHRNHPFITFLGWAVTGVMLLAGIGALVSPFIA